MRDRIRLLSEEVYSKIAAGEAIDRPAAVVRELIDNSIDAGAKEIVINVINAGMDLIAVSDDGMGIDKEDLKLSLSEHATSKIQTVDDIFSVKSMGFRGEALYSIERIAKIKIFSNTDETGQSIGYKISNDDYQIEPIAFKKGTKVTVTDLFYNLPARKNFVKSKIVELNAIKKVVIDKVLSNLNVSFALYNDDKIVFRSDGKGDFQSAFFDVYGIEERFEIKSRSAVIDDKTSMRIYYSDANVFFSSRKYQGLSVNNRAVYAGFLYSAIDAGIKNFISPGRRPLVFIELDIDPSLIDVNIHPAKKEIKFYDQQKIFESIRINLYKAFGEGIGREIFISGADDAKLYKDENNFLNFDKPASFESQKKYFDYLVENDSTKEIIDNEYIDGKNYKILGSVFENYIIIEKESKIFFIDQHAAAEAIIYADKKSKYEKTKTIEKLIIPIIFEVPNWNETTERKIETLNKNGFLIERQEGTTLSLREAPEVLINRKDYDSIIETILAYLEKDFGDKDNIVNDVLIEASCKEAIKKGDSLNLLEISEIV
ncbi:MAG TPA: DNA mismatch repair endonuclease MutL, partial [Spirochaetota bacterium]|nr:DNA mismatch repair endonuclease MutL [Spirochaetota bacterium]